MHARPDVSPDVLAAYAADAAREVEHVEGLVESALHRHKGVRVVDDEGAIGVELHLVVAWGADVPTLGTDVQRRVSEYLTRMAGVQPAGVDVFVDEIVPPAA